MSSMPKFSPQTSPPGPGAPDAAEGWGAGADELPGAGGGRRRADRAVWPVQPASSARAASRGRMRFHGITQRRYSSVNSRFRRTPARRFSPGKSSGRTPAPRGRKHPRPGDAPPHQLRGGKSQ